MVFENSAASDGLAIGSATTGAGAGSARPPDASRSISVSTASASAARPFDSSQRGDSGIALRRYHTIRAAMPTITNIQRQPQFGITKRPVTAAMNKAEFVIVASPAHQRPRRRGGTNSLIIA